MSNIWKYEYIVILASGGKQTLKEAPKHICDSP